MSLSLYKGALTSLITVMQISIYYHMVLFFKLKTNNICSLIKFKEQIRPKHMLRWWTIQEVFIPSIIIIAFYVDNGHHSPHTKTR